MTEQPTPLFFHRELKEHYLKNVVQACAMFTLIEDFILDTEEFEELAYNRNYASKARGFKARLEKLRSRYEEVHLKNKELLAQALLDVDLLIIALAQYSSHLSAQNMSISDERKAAKALLLVPKIISRKRASREREQKRAALNLERRARVKKSLGARASNPKAGND